MINLKNYSKVYKNQKGIKDINITFEKGNVYGVVGPNGAGKTTLLNAITGFTKGSGFINVNGHTKRDRFLEEISYQMDSEYMVGSKIKDLAKVTHILCDDFDKDQFLTYIESFKIDKNQNYNKLSKGQKMSVKIALTLSRKTPIYVFDEPLSGIDIVLRDIIMQNILEKANEDTLVIISSHELHDLDNKVDQVVFLDEGHILEITTLDDLKDQFGKSLSDIYLDKFH